MKRSINKMVHKYHIVLDNKYFAGLSDEVQLEDYSGNGWYIINHNESNKLLFTDKKDRAKVIEGWRNLNSYLERIIRLHSNGKLEFVKLTIQLFISDSVFLRKEK